MAKLRFPPPTEQTLELVFDDAVALTGIRLQPTAVKNDNVTTAIVDQSGVLQMSSGYRHALAPAAKYTSDELLSHEKVWRTYSVVTQQEPATEPLFHGVQAVAHSGLRNLGNEGLGVAQKQLLDGSRARELLLQTLRREPKSVTSYGDNGSTAG